LGHCWSWDTIDRSETRGKRERSRECDMERETVNIKSELWDTVLFCGSVLFCVVHCWPLLFSFLRRVVLRFSVSDCVSSYRFKLNIMYYRTMAVVVRIVYFTYRFLFNCASLVLHLITNYTPKILLIFCKYFAPLIFYFFFTFSLVFSFRICSPRSHQMLYFRVPHKQSVKY
jgi:hypothetical protein